MNPMPTDIASVPITLITCNDKHGTYTAQRRKEAMDAVASLQNLSELTCEIGRAHV